MTKTAASGRTSILPLALAFLCLSASSTATSSAPVHLVKQDNREQVPANDAFLQTIETTALKEHVSAPPPPPVYNKGMSVYVCVNYRFFTY